ncbi:UDP-4-amino-4,6-dideoxy-N-acetyl-beta-L-altrosamine transaminase [Candidatus Aerophobetes bacterium]|nr:UDP-4-amino-4,6-dideoxy-N-acetyl-beta-L-altrosamine transaminase [Candidatus Aerophobetes bacterium]
MTSKDARFKQRRFLSYGHQLIDDSDIEAVVKVLKSDMITQGPCVGEFEQNLSSYCRANYAVVFSSGTAAFHAAYFVANIKKGDEIITSPITFLSTANAALFLSARPVFADIEEDTGNINPGFIKKAITKKTKAIVPVHYAGHPVHLERISELVQEHNLLVIEDACHALGAEYKNEKVGSCRYSDMTVFSFHPVKSITTGEGGAVLTNNKEYYKKLIMFRQHGMTKNKADFKEFSSGDWYHEMQILGYNYRLTDIQCALGISQLKKLDEFIQRRREIVEIYKDAFKENEFFDLLVEKNYARSSWHLYPIRLKDRFKDKKREIFTKLREEGLGVQVHYIPVYWQPYYRQLGYEKGICPKAEDFYRKDISIPLYPSMDNEDVAYVIEKIFEVFQEA